MPIAAGLLAAVAMLSSTEPRAAPDEVFAPDKFPFPVEIRNECFDPVWLFYGRDPAQRSENLVNVNGWAQSVELMMPGDVLRLVDRDLLELGRVTVQPDTSSIVVLPSCTALQERA